MYNCAPGGGYKAWREGDPCEAPVLCTEVRGRCFGAIWELEWVSPLGTKYRAEGSARTVPEAKRAVTIAYRQICGVYLDYLQGVIDEVRSIAERGGSMEEVRAALFGR
jgi:hypothetical protein